MSENIISSVKDVKSPQLYLDYPCLIGTISCYNQQIIISQGGKDYPFLINEESQKSWLKLFSLMDGSKSVKELQERFFPNAPQFLEQTLANLAEQGLLDDGSQVDVNCADNQLIKLEQEVEILLEESNFPRLINTDTIKLSLPFLYGVAIEHYHLSSQQQLVYGALLNWQTKTDITQLIKQLYHQEFPQEYLWLQAMRAIDIDKNMLDDTIPLPQTQALGNALQYWASCEPNFNLILLSIWYRQRQKYLQSYLHVCTMTNINSSFLEPIQNLLDNQLDVLANDFWQLIPAPEPQTYQRWQEQIKLFIKILGGFYLGMEDYYQENSQTILRQVSLI